MNTPQSGPSQSLRVPTPSVAPAATSRAGSVLNGTAGPSRIGGGGGAGRATTSIAFHSQAVNVADVERVLAEMLDEGGAEEGEGGDSLSLVKLEKVLGELMEGISNAFTPGSDSGKTEALYNQAINQLQTLIQTLINTGLGATPLSLASYSPSPASSSSSEPAPPKPLPTITELRDSINLSSQAAFDSGREMRDLSRGVVDILNGSGSAGRSGGLGGGDGGVGGAKSKGVRIA